MRKQNAVCLAVLAAGLLVAGRALAGSLDPTNAPGPTMHTLEEIYQKLDTTLGPVQYTTLMPDTSTVAAGYYAATNLTAVEADLVADNIKTNVTIFGIAGTLSTNTGSVYLAMVPKTGQTTSYQTGDDGTYQKGVSLPDPRFSIQADTNCVLDNMTGLVWARNANISGAGMTWPNAVIFCEALNYGGQTDWRLPNRRELLSLIDDGRESPSLPVGHPFTGVKLNVYWSATSFAGSPSSAWDVDMSIGTMSYPAKNYDAVYVWPVRGGQ